MTILELLRNEAADEARRVFFAATTAGLANALLLGFANVAATTPGSASLGVFAVFVLALAVYGYGATYSHNRTADIVQSALLRVKVRIVKKIERAELEQLERIGASEISDRITENMTVISDSAGLLAELLQSICILAFATLYLMSLFLPAFALMVITLGIGAGLYVIRQREIRDHLMFAAQQRLEFFEKLMDMLRGFKEIKFSQLRGQDIREDIVETGESLRVTTLKASYLFNGNSVFANFILFALIGALVFVLPLHTEIDAKTLGSLVAAGIFVWGPMGSLVGGLPAYVRCNVALRQIEVLEAKLSAEARDVVNDDRAVDPWRGQAVEIKAQDIEYTYAPSDGGEVFSIGPMNLTIPAGEVLFIVGGNGSGKSTFLKVLTGLYPPARGALTAGGVAVGEESVAAYRELISAVFSDFHLFSRLYGLRDVEPSEVHRLLAQMQLKGKTWFKDGRFTDLKLSTGQRKRLAMIIALLEDRPICVFDEWAADQDPEFRKYFYEELLPALQRKGKTVIAVSHDDRYFHCADRVVTMEEGRIRSIERPASPA